MGNLKEVKIYDFTGRRIELDNHPHFLIVVGEKEDGEIICEYGVLDKTKFRKSDTIYKIASFSKFPEFEKNLQEIECLFLCAMQRNNTDNIFSLFPRLVKYKLEGKENEDDEFGIVCASKLPKTGELIVELLQIKLSDINEAGFTIGNSFYRVGMLE